jgi:hypothetical protein
VRKRRTVGERDVGVHYRLGVDDHVDVVVLDAEQVMRLDDFESLVHQGRRIDRDLAAHVPRRMSERVLHRD